MVCIFLHHGPMQTGGGVRYKACLSRRLLLNGEDSSVDVAADQGRFKLRLGKQQMFFAHLAVPYQVNMLSC